MMNTAVDGIVSIDSKGIIIAINEAVEKLLGWTRDELIGTAASAAGMDGFANKPVDIYALNLEIARVKGIEAMQYIGNILPSILIVDDEPTNLRVLKNILQDHYRLIFAKSGVEALKLANEQRPNLILLDIMMPDMTGLEVCQKLKASASLASIPVIFVTALSDETDEAQGFAVGAVDYITKPVSPAIVKARVRTHLSLVQADELRVTRLQIIQRLGRAAEYKDNETGMHVMRMSHFSKVLA